MSFEHTCGQELAPEVVLLFNGRRRVTRRFTLGKNGNIDDVIFKAYGVADPGAVTSCTTGYTNLKLVSQTVQPAGRSDQPSTLVQVFETLTSTLVAEGPRVLGRDINDILIAKIPYIGLPGAGGGLSIGDAFTVGGIACVVSELEAEENDAFTRITYVARQVGSGMGGTGEFIVGGDEVLVDSNERHTLIRRSTQPTSGTYVPGAIGSLLTVDSVMYVLSEIKKTENAGYREIVRVYVEATGTWVAIGPDKTDRELNGLLRVRRLLVAIAGTVPPSLVVGTTTYTYSGTTTYLAGVSDAASNEAVTLIETVYTQAGILEAEKEFDAAAGLLFVTFQSLGQKFTPTALNGSISGDPTVVFQGGAAASVRYDRIRNTNGLRSYVVTVQLQLNGSALATSGENEVQSFQAWMSYGKPGEVTVSGSGITASPGNDRFVKVLVTEVFTTESTIPDGYKPFSVKNWASYRVTFIPEETGSPVLVAKGASGYLADSSFTITGGGEFSGIPVDSAAGTAGSDPTPAAFYALNNQVIDSTNKPDVVTDLGVRWYRRRKVTVVGTFGTYLNA